VHSLVPPQQQLYDLCWQIPGALPEAQIMVGEIFVAFTEVLFQKLLNIPRNLANDMNESMPGQMDPIKQARISPAWML